MKESVLPFSRFSGVDIVLGPEMKSTGEVMGIADSFGLAFYKAQEAAGSKLPFEGNVLVTVAGKNRDKLIPVAQQLEKIGFNILATEGTSKLLTANNIKNMMTVISA